MSGIRYRDFQIRIRRGAGEVYRAEVDSPAGEAWADFRLPFKAVELEEMLEAVVDSLRSARGKPDGRQRSAATAAVATPLRQFGHQLFAAVFSGPVRSRYDTSQGILQGGENVGLRIKLRIDPDCPELDGLPWEYLYESGTRRFLNLSRYTPIVRYLDVPQPVEALPLALPLRILLVAAEPSDWEPLDLARETHLIQDALARVPDVELVPLGQATPSGLQRTLATETFHVVHFMGHGDFDPDTGKGMIVLENEEGLGHPLGGWELGMLLVDVPTVRLLFLNACETASVAREGGVDPFGSVARLVVLEGGVPAVVAMQRPISDGAAIAFAREFYPTLARGEPVEFAVAEGRRAISLEAPGTVEWGTPALYTRQPTGVIFEMRPPAAVKPKPAPPPVEAVSVPVPEVERAARRRPVWIAPLLLVVLVLGYLGTAFARHLWPFPSATPVPTSVGGGEGQGRIAFTTDRDGNNEIYVMKADGTDQTRLTHDPGDDWSPAWSPDGRRIAFTSTRDATSPGMHNIYIMNADGSNVVRLTFNQAWDEYAAWSPDGRRIAFVSTGDDNAEVFGVNTDGSDYQRLTQNQADDINPTWSPDSRQLAFASRRTGSWQIFVMDGNGDNQTRITHSEANDLHPAWSPDGSKIAFFSDRDGNSEIYVMNADGTGQTRLTDDPDRDEHPTWSPDGSAIVFWSDRLGNASDVYVMGADGNHQTRLTRHTAADGSPSWGE